MLAAGLCGLAPKLALADSRAGTLPRRPIPSTGESLPVIGLGNSNAFRSEDKALSLQVIQRLIDFGGAYIDCGGRSRFVVADVVAELGVSDEVFLGTYFTGADDAKARDEAMRLKSRAGRRSLDLMHNYPEDAVPHWDRFKAWKDEGLTRHIGVSRHRKEAYPAMLDLMSTGTVDVLQVNYSLLEPEAEKRVLPAALDQGVAVTINRPFINGRYFDVVRGRELPAWAAEFDCDTWAQFSLKYIISHPAVTSVLTETANPEHAEDNLGAGLGRLPDEAMRKRMRTYFRSLT
jgi:diketogulonate reductase-like aldo/keto reductase